MTFRFRGWSFAASLVLGSLVLTMAAAAAESDAGGAKARRTLDVTWNEANHCAMARVMRRGQRYQQNFSLTAYPTRTAAEKAAAAWVQAKIAELPPEIPRKGRVTSRNKSGVVGVWLVPVRIAKPDGRRYEYWRWTANWPGCPHRGGVTWYVHQYGDDGAFVLAVLSRRLETVDRAKVLAEFDRIDGTREYDEILARQAMDAPNSSVGNPRSADEGAADPQADQTAGDRKTPD